MMEQMISQITASANYLLNNQVILPVLIALIISSRSTKRDNRADDDENFIKLKEQYRELWSELVILNHAHLQESIDDVKNERVRLLAFQLVEFFYMVYFLYYAKNSPYREQWEQNMNHIFSQPLIISAFKKHAKVFNKEYQEFIDWRYVNGKIGRVVYPRLKLRAP
jgi:hypothetical protein